MSSAIHPTAIVEKGARLGERVTIGAYAFVGSRVSLGDDCQLHHHATVEGNTEIGGGCEVFPYACIGLKTQDLKFTGGEPGLRVGKQNVFREFCTVHAATGDGDFTVIGENSYFLAYSHVAHDCVVGNRVIMSNNATLAGHVIVGDHVVFGGFAAAHQFCRIGTRAMIGGCSKVEKDVPPYLLVDGNPAVVRSYNLVGLQRAGFDDERIRRVKTAYRILYRDGLNRVQALEQLRESPDADAEEFRVFRGFIEASKRGLAGKAGNGGR